ncbi:hypothetical protein [Saccharothrix sp. HUAS TT1]|uniref:hypothetical protein n=1 Tax=unclassified Saccharothrix TaxID=2593673 RepID=UPI00345BA407
MPDPFGGPALTGLAVAALSGFAAVAFSFTAATSTTAPTPTGAAPTPAVPIQVVVPTATTPSGSITPKDLLVPLGTLLGAALGFGGAVTGARLSANAQDRRARQDAEVKRQEEERARTVKRLEAFAEQANTLMGDAATLANSEAEEWNGPTTATREALRLRAAQMLGTGHLLDPTVEEPVRKFIVSVLEIGNSPTAAQARQAAQRCGANFEALMRVIGGELKSAKTPTGAVEKTRG